MRNKVYFAAGCFWGIQHIFDSQDGVLKTKVGYMGGKTKNPIYEDVCRGDTGHAEVVEVIYDGNYEDLVKLFFEIHDATQVGRQGPDVGDQYRSAIFYTTQEQKEIAEKIINILKEKGYKIATQLSEAKEFYPAEDYHQKYFAKKGEEPYCHVRKSLFD